MVPVRHPCWTGSGRYRHSRASSFVLRVQSVSEVGVDPVSDAAEEEPDRVDDEVGDGVPCLVGKAVGVDAVGGGALHAATSAIRAPVSAARTCAASSGGTAFPTCWNCLL